MKTFEFSIVASGLDPEASDFESRFYDHGCDDATVSFQKGHIIIDFAREAARIQDAIFSAVMDVLKAGADIDRVEPDPLVSLSDIAVRAGLTRAAMTNYFKGRRAQAFPAPIVRVTSGSPLWDWAAVASWLHDRHKVAAQVVDEAIAVRATNAVLSCGVRAELEASLKARLYHLEPAD
jgi:hypothetical protein